MCRRRRVDRDGANLDAVRAIDIEGAVGTDRRSWELAVSTPGRQIAPGIGDRQARALPGPTASREWPFTGAGGTAVAGEQAGARDERHDKQSSHASL